MAGSVRVRGPATGDSFSLVMLNDFTYSFIVTFSINIGRHITHIIIGMSYTFSGVSEYILKTKDMVDKLDNRLHHAKENVEQIQKIMHFWTKAPLFERTEGKISSLLYLTDREDRLRKRYSDISSASIKIHQLVQVGSALRVPIRSLTF